MTPVIKTDDYSATVLLFVVLIKDYNVMQYFKLMIQLISTKLGYHWD